MKKGIAACYSKHSVQISDSYCSGCSKSKPSCSSSISHNPIPSLQNSVTCLYRSNFPNADEDDCHDDDIISITITWTSILIGRGLNIQIMTNSASSSDQLRKCKGSKTIAFPSGSRFDVKWDLSTAEYDNGPEPTSNFYVTVCKNSKPILTLGDYEEHKMLTLRNATFAPVSRAEYFSGSSLSCITKAKFCDTGKPHDIMINYIMEENDGETKDPILIVSVDKKKVVIVKKLQWNFRGNQCVFVDGIVVDLMWDVHEWLYNPGSGNGLFLFRTRNGVGSRLWLVKDERFKEQKETGFSFVVYLDYPRYSPKINPRLRTSSSLICTTCTLYGKI